MPGHDCIPIDHPINIIIFLWLCFALVWKWQEKKNLFLIQKQDANQLFAHYVTLSDVSIYVSILDISLGYMTV